MPYTAKVYADVSTNSHNESVKRNGVLRRKVKGERTKVPGISYLGHFVPKSLSFIVVKVFRLYLSPLPFYLFFTPVQTKYLLKYF